MELPDFLKNLVEKKLASLSSQKLALYSQKLSDRYRENKKNKGSFMSSEEDILAYLATRLPATYGAIFNVLSQVKEKIPFVDTFLDVGAGPGTGFWAARELFNLKSVTFIEKEKGLISLGKSFTDQLSEISCEWIQKDLEFSMEFPNHDFILMAYSLGELSENSRKLVLNNLWKATNKGILLIEPGTPAGFKRILDARQFLISLGAHLLAPCSHQNVCSLQGSDWCHFSQRIERSSLHRKVKKAELNYEDEKFSYVVFSRESILNQGARIIRHPQKRAGHVELKLCSETGIESKIISRKQKEIYSEIKRLEWGSLLNLNSNDV